MLVQAQAFKRTGVSAASTITVSSTDTAALQLLAGTGAGNAAQTAFYSSTVTHAALYLDFTKGKNNASGFAFGAPQAGAGDIYHFRGLFQVKNIKATAKCISVYVPAAGVNGLDKIYLRATSDNVGPGTLVATTGGSKSTCLSVPAGATYNVDFWWTITSGTANGPFNVRVEAT